MPVTHEVFNQVPPARETDTADDPVLLQALHREGVGWAEEQVRAVGRRDRPAHRKAPRPSGDRRA
jgi:putative acyl-CoA dehydrogenase